MPRYENREKLAAERLDYSQDWSLWLDEGDTIVDADVLDPDEGITVSAPIVLSPYVAIWVEGGTAGENYKVPIQATTAAGRTPVRTWRFDVG